MNKHPPRRRLLGSWIFMLLNELNRRKDISRMERGSNGPSLNIGPVSAQWWEVVYCLHGSGIRCRPKHKRLET